MDGLVLLLVGSLLGTPAVSAQYQPVRAEESTRSAHEQKIDPQLLSEIYRRRHVADQSGFVPTMRIDIDTRGRALVDIRASVTTALEKSIATLGGTILFRSSEHRSIVARVPILALPRLAKDPTVHFIEPALPSR